ncbi:MAG: hypothetical protein GY753_01350, partial [Gammaproteobacteria bacterium]|nr:hypothetical protein [Gammaproteobacteria bacterium]
MDGNEAVGKVLTSDANGNATWQTVPASSGNRIEDADGDTKVQVEETADEDIIRFDMAGTEFFRMDSGRFEVLNTGNSVFIGEGAGANDYLTNNSNVFVGYQAGNANTWGTNNTASGYGALENNTTGNYNTASGYLALENNTTGDDNTAYGIGTLSYNTTGIFNTANGSAALGYNTTGSYNTASGTSALLNTTTGVGNTAVGSDALLANITGSYNTALGFGADVALYSDNLTNATAIGYWARVSTSNSLVLGGTGAYAVNVGIGVTSPDTTLHVVGSIKMVDGNQAAGYVPVSDAMGVMTWTDPALLPKDDGDWTVSGSDMYSSVSG